MNECQNKKTTKKQSLKVVFLKQNMDSPLEQLMTLDGPLLNIMISGNNCHNKSIFRVKTLEFCLLIADFFFSVKGSSSFTKKVADVFWQVTEFDMC